MLHKQAEISAYKKPSCQCTLHQELLYINDALKETAKLTTKDWYAWNPRLQSILSTWSPALKHLNGITKLGNSKFDQKLDRKLCTIIQSHAKLMGQDNINFLFMQPTKAEPWRFHELCASLPLTKISWAKAESMGHKLMPVLKIKRVTDQARFIPAYHNCITNLQDNGQARDYKAVCVGLFK
ncbi:hypothetical protein NDA11_007721 [Ustilago hordei]|nr:hypothetical protein NDA10_000440 [Ustilago hordei]KAJ1581099.1 hypothetical protein NDA15_004471 [Ustilago hordei]KAJ1582655.1 hypothetical protein NDA12_000326 [Ustilago hordei]KAJ1588860.1 hypothetical protein NDA11_007721 [Ustilago hordei]UTT92230.1 hypothetical protein NDA17_000122 [Ustilago hordei]